MLRNFTTGRLLAFLKSAMGSVKKDVAQTYATKSELNAASGVTAGSYGPPTDASPSAGGTITVPQVTVNARGLVTDAVDRTITLPSGGGGGGGGDTGPGDYQQIDYESAFDQRGETFDGMLPEYVLGGEWRDIFLDFGINQPGETYHITIEFDWGTYAFYLTAPEDTDFDKMYLRLWRDGGILRAFSASGSTVSDGPYICTEYILAIDVSASGYVSEITFSNSEDVYNIFLYARDPVPAEK